MEYLEAGNLRENLPFIVKEDWHWKLRMLYQTIKGLNAIHQLSFIDHDFHDGNIVLNRHRDIVISDLGLSKSIQSSSNEGEIYGILPFIAPEILRGNPYTLASDIYSFSMIMWEFTSGIPPFNDRQYGLHLGLNICQGKRPEIIENTPQCYIDLMKKCWNKNPLKRPTALEVRKVIENWIEYFDDFDEADEKLKNDIIEFKKVENQDHKQDLKQDHNRKTHQDDYYRNVRLDFTKKLNELLDKLEEENF